VSFKWQPTWKTGFLAVPTPSVQWNWINCVVSLTSFKPDRQVFEAMGWKPWILSGDVLRLQDEARLRPVVRQQPTKRYAPASRRLSLFPILAE
jgi:hypothetical protein